MGVLKFFIVFILIFFLTFVLFNFISKLEPSQPIITVSNCEALEDVAYINGTVAGREVTIDYLIKTGQLDTPVVIMIEDFNWMPKCIRNEN